jgi:hypothetical protein
MNHLTCRALLCYAKALLFSCLLAGAVNLPAQVFNSYPTHCWFKSNPAAPLATDSLFIGNYKGLDLTDSTAKAHVKGVASQYSLRSGTLFVVLGTTDSSTTDKPLFGFGGTNIYRTFMMVLGDTIHFDKDLAKAPGIVRISYSMHRDSYYGEKLRQAPNTYISELIYFKKVLEQEEVRKIESYLALKYSINITANSNPSLRHYANASAQHLWNARTDGYFDEEVMALGRLDSLEWLQTQTRTADGESIIISLDTTTAKGAMPAITVANNSVLVLSKSDFSPKELRCGEGLEHRLWKIRLQDWNSPADAFYITLNEEISPSEYPKLSNGFHEQVLPVTVGNGISRIRVPFIPELATNQYYLMWGASGISCAPLCRVFVRECQGENNGSVELNVAPEALPAEAELYNLLTNQRVQAILTQPVTLLENLNTGHYQLTVQNRSLQLVDQLIELSNCPPNNTLLPSYTALDENGMPVGGSSSSFKTSGTFPDAAAYTVRNPDAQSRGISAFPNPACAKTEVAFQFNGLDDRKFRVEIYDDGGAYQTSLDFTPSAETPVLKHNFQLPGTYHVRFYAPEYSDFIKVVIHN